MILTGLISLALFALMASGIYIFGDNLGLSLISLLPVDQLPSFLTIGAEWLMRIILWAISILIFKHVILIVAAPLLSEVSKVVEEKMTGEIIEEPISAVKSFTRGARLSSSHIVKELLITALLLALSLIPGVALITAPLIFLTQAYFAGAGNLDIFMERRFNLDESKLFIKNNRGLAIANGSLFLGLLLIPFIGVFLAPTWATISATIGALRTNK